MMNEDIRRTAAGAGVKLWQIAEALGMPLATVLSKYNPAIKKLEQYLREE